MILQAGTWSNYNFENINIDSRQDRMMKFIQLGSQNDQDKKSAKNLIPNYRPFLKAIGLSNAN
jgi:hypothetical protein